MPLQRLVIRAGSPWAIESLKEGLPGSRTPFSPSPPPSFFCTVIVSDENIALPSFLSVCSYPPPPPPPPPLTLFLFFLPFFLSFFPLYFFNLTHTRTVRLGVKMGPFFSPHSTGVLNLWGGEPLLRGLSMRVTSGSQLKNTSVYLRCSY